jgi:hypothetical protein
MNSTSSSFEPSGSSSLTSAHERLQVISHLRLATWHFVAEAP